MSEINITEIEEKWKKYWEKEKIYKFDKNSKSEIYSIDTPPPTVSGEMHIGHAFSYSQQDFIVRYKRMRKYNVFYPFGTDDNGLPTEKLIENLKNVRSKEMSRDEFIKLCLSTLKEILPKFIQDWKDLAISCDYDITYSTIDTNSRKLSQEYFIKLYKKGLIYKANFPTFWDVKFQTPVAQAELEDKEKKTLFSTLKFLVDKKTLPIATTRPELLGACVAVFINPKDKRYIDLAGKKAKVPLFNHEVPIIKDESADMKKGTGVLMICSYGDKYDVDAIQRHKLTPRIIINKNGTLNLEKYKGLKIKEARTKILEELKELNFIIEQKEILHSVNVYEKSGEEIEFLPVEQWFIKIIEDKKKFIEFGRKINWIPEYMRKRYENWINGLEWDWSISRERHFGVPVPAWHCKKCDKIILPEIKELPINPIQVKKQCPKCKSLAIPDEKVLDTWATSSLTPQIASSLVNDEIKIPYSLRPQAHDIIRTWAFYTIVRAVYHENSIPWKEIAISGNVKLEGEKMSKSKGNIVKPQEVMKNYGTDSLRYWAASSKLGEDINYYEKDVLTGKRF
ncbi:MAG: valine--tRNA ligase, partial [Candidatus Pacearchaeota archaeon]